MSGSATRLLDSIGHDVIGVLEPFFYDNIAPLAILDREFNFIRVNKAYAAADDRDPEEFSGRNHFELYPSEENEAIFRQVVATKKPYKIRAKPFVYAANPERGISYWDWSLSPVLGSDGEVTMLIFSLYDVSETIRATEELKRFFQLSVDALCIIDTQGRLLMVNDAFCHILGLSREELRSIQVLDLIHPDDRDKTLKTIQKHLEDRQPVVDFENRYCCKDGSFRWLQWSSVIDASQGRTYAVARDITSQKELEREMLRLSQMNILAEMAAAISHEVRNPMTSVRGFLQLLRSKEECAQYVDYFDLMIEELDRANSIITEYLSLGRSRASNVSIQSLNRIVETLIPLMQADAVTESRVIACELKEIPQIQIDDKEIRQLILNLVRNGLEATPRAGVVTIRTDTDGENVVLSVHDQGPEIPDDILRRMGTPFFTTKNGGTGLGLATCYGIARRHNASLVIDTGPNGTTVRVSIPIRTRAEDQTVGQSMDHSLCRRA